MQHNFCILIGINSYHPYRFSPVHSDAEFDALIGYIHAACHELLNRSLGESLPVAGNICVFSHYDDEFEFLKQVRSRLCLEPDDPNRKYYELAQPIHFDATESTPEAIYTHLYIRQPDPYRYQTGDIDFLLSPSDYRRLKARLARAEPIPGARLFERADPDLIELYHPDIDALAYISPNVMSEKLSSTLPAA